MNTTLVLETQTLASRSCYDNALAERVNGILKLEYGLDGQFAIVAQAREAVVQAIWRYNHERPHNSLDLQTPYDVHNISCANGGLSPHPALFAPPLSPKYALSSAHSLAVALSTYFRT